MNKKEKQGILTGLFLMLVFAVWTVLIRVVDVQPAGPDGTLIGFAAFNLWFHRLTGVHMVVYTITDWLGLIPVLVCLCFGGIGFFQWINRRSLFQVDPDILLLGFYYLLVVFGYLFFEMVPINHRPVLINGVLEASYPSSTTLLVLSVMPTLNYQVCRRADSPLLRNAVSVFVVLFSGLMVFGRLISGVHWATDILGSILLSSGLFILYRSSAVFADRKKTIHTMRRIDGVQ